jgi:hypothetical protein
MRYNPPPNWPPPPTGWEPSPSWTPDPAWPPPPPGWQLFVEDEPRETPVAEPPAAAPPQAGAPEGLTELTAEQLSVEHVGARAMARWEDEDRYKIGTIIGISADPAMVTVQLSGSEAITFPRGGSHGGPTAPRLYVAPLQ